MDIFGSTYTSSGGKSSSASGFDMSQLNTGWFNFLGVFNLSVRIMEV